MRLSLHVLSVGIASVGAIYGCNSDDTDNANSPEAVEGTMATTDAASTGATTSSPPADAADLDDDAAGLGCAAEVENDSTDGASEDVMQTWGAPCTEDQTCIDLLGEGGVCLLNAVAFELPLGYCSKTCTLPDSTTQYVPDDPQCDPNGGVDCVGQSPLFEACAVPCTDDNQCSRPGYSCRGFPLIGAEGDPQYCLMPDCCQEAC